jgi:hypothetical protein
MIKVPWSTLFLTAGWCFCLLVTGCKSAPATAPTPLADVLIRGNTPGQIGRVTAEVFNEKGYQTTESHVDRFVFEKPGTKWNTLAYGGWFGGTQVWIRVKVDIINLGGTLCRLQCQAYWVQDRGSSVEEETPITKVRRHNYRPLLEEVAKRLGTS